MALGWLNPYTVGHYRLEVANDVFNGTGASHLIVLLCYTQPVVWPYPVKLRVAL
jgi:hypothetical protein